MPTQWTLSYRIDDEAMQHRCRLNFEQFRKDPNVENVLFGMPPRQPNHRLIQVNFRAGYTAPRTHELRPLYRLFGVSTPDDIGAYPTISSEAQVVIDHQALDDMEASRKALHAKSESGSPLLLSPEFSPTDVWKKSVPPWSDLGLWIREKTSNSIFEVLAIAPGLSTTVTIQEWRRFTPYVISLQAIKELFGPAARPKDPDTWHFRLMGDDAF